MLKIYRAFPIDPYNPTLQMEDRVRLIKLGGDLLEGKTGKLVGISANVLMVYWIIELDEPTIIPYGIKMKCVTMPSVCLERIE